MVSNVQLQQSVDKILLSISDLKKSTDETKVELLNKFDDLAERIDSIEAKVDTNKEATDALSTIVEENKAELIRLNLRIVSLEDKVKMLETIPEKLNETRETVEERTNRQLRETLVFKNIIEVNPDESYNDTKVLLSKLISEHCHLQYDDVYSEIKRAHRESNRPSHAEFSRRGKRHIFAAFHSWDLCQKIIETFKNLNIRNQNFKINAEQKYGPLTTKRRNLAMQKRKELKETGAIISGYVAFPARLMVNTSNQLDAEGKKIYKLHTNFSTHVIE